ncbi:MAG TPA: hypothetical protein VFK69_09205 [Candidatus Eisenbacteria bacterium]|nr:hypothetical protein [Candidatus Eisenbacteria bacterium]
MRSLAVHWTGRVVVVCAVLVTASCAHMGGSKRTAGGVHVTDVDLGRAADSTNISITDVTHDFKTTDPVFATVKYDHPGTESATIGVKWYSGTTLLDQDTTPAETGEHHAHLFRMHAPPAAGAYKLEVSVNDKVVETKKFDVK